MGTKRLACPDRGATAAGGDQGGGRSGGKVVGSVRAPLSTSDFSSYLLQAPASGAQVVGLANAGADFSNSLKAAHEFGLTSTMKPATLLAFITDIHSLGLEIDGAGALSDRSLVLGPERQEPRLRQALLRQDRRYANLQSGRLLFSDDDLSQRDQGGRFD
jgi:Periplasmic binding protein